MYGQLKNDLIRELEEIRTAGLYKEERFIHIPQGAELEVEYPEYTAHRTVVNMCTEGLARIRVQLSAAHEKERLDRDLAAFKEVWEKYGILHKTRGQIVAMYGE